MCERVRARFKKSDVLALFCSSKSLAILHSLMSNSRSQVVYCIDANQQFSLLHSCVVTRAARVFILYI